MLGLCHASHSKRVIRVSDRYQPIRKYRSGNLSHISIAYNVTKIVYYSSILCADYEKESNKGFGEWRGFKKAIEAVSNRHSIRKDSKTYNIPFSTFQESIKKNLLATKPRIGRHSTFSPEVGYKILPKLFYGFTPH